MFTETVCMLANNPKHKQYLLTKDMHIQIIHYKKKQVFAKEEDCKILVLSRKEKFAEFVSCFVRWKRKLLIPFVLERLFITHYCWQSENSAPLVGESEKGWLTKDHWILLNWSNSLLNFSNILSSDSDLKVKGQVLELNHHHNSLSVPQ